MKKEEAEHSLESMIGRVLSPVSPVIIAVIIGLLFVLLFGGNPIAAGESMFGGALGTAGGLSQVLNIGAVLVLTALCSLLAIRAGVWNIGGEGQLYLGGIGAALVGVFLPTTIGGFGLPAALFMSALLGAVWGGIAGGLRWFFKVDILVSTTLFNFVAYLLVQFLTRVPLRDPAAVFDSSPPLPLQDRMPFLIPSIGVNFGIVVAAILAVLVYFLVEKTAFGFEIRTIGGNIGAAFTSGLKVDQTIFVVMMICGALGGLAGGVLISGVSFSLFYGVSRGYGYIGIAVAALAKFKPVPVIASAVFFSVLDIGGPYMQEATGVSFTLTEAIAGLVIILLLLGEYLRNSDVGKWFK
jgi:general nucleoside transport system permease protein